MSTFLLMVLAENMRCISTLEIGLKRNLIKNLKYIHYFSTSNIIKTDRRKQYKNTVSEDNNVHRYEISKNKDVLKKT